MGCDVEWRKFDKAPSKYGPCPTSPVTVHSPHIHPIPKARSLELILGALPSRPNSKSSQVCLPNLSQVHVDLSICPATSTSLTCLPANPLMWYPVEKSSNVRSNTRCDPPAPMSRGPCLSNPTSQTTALRFHILVIGPLDRLFFLLDGFSSSAPSHSYSPSDLS